MNAETDRPASLSMNYSIFVVEDEPVLAMYLEDILADLGHTVAGSEYSLAGALQKVNSVRFDAAIIDFRLEDGTAEPLAIVLTERGIPIVFTTGDSRQESFAQFKDASVVSKPYTADTIRSALDRAMSVSRLT